MGDYLTELTEKLKLNQLDNNPNLFFIEKYLAVKPSSFLVALSTFVIIVALTSNATNIVVSLVCCLIPAYFTFVTLESSDREEYIKYLTYWIMFALIESVAPFLNFILTSFLYISLRIGITIVLLHPQFNMSVKFYKIYVQPQLKKYEQNIDLGIDKAKVTVENQYKRFSRN